MIEIIRRPAGNVVVRVIEIALKSYCIARAWELIRSREDRKKFVSFYTFDGVEYGEIGTKAGKGSDNGKVAREMIRTAFPELNGHPDGPAIHFPLEEVQKLL
jgi:hypothetical protein